MIGAVKVIERGHFDDLLAAIAQRGFTIVGPTVREQAIVYDEISSAAELPVGWTDEQDGGYYRLRRRDDEALFGYAVGPHSWKQYQLPAEVKLWRARLDGRGALDPVSEPSLQEPKYAFLGARSCELHAIGILDRVLAGGRRSKADDRASAGVRRASAGGRRSEADAPASAGVRRSEADDPPPAADDPFIVAVQCGVAGGTCFCVSMNTGPVAERGFDLALTEIVGDTVHRFVVEIGSERGAEVLEDVPHRDAAGDDLGAASSVHERTASQMGRELDTTDIRDLLYRNFQHPRWDDVAARCLTCGNCTMVCPTCFCTTVEDVTDLQGEHVERYQRWDSCFTIDYSHIHGGSVRSSTRSRYRQWMTHKLATWWDQFGSSGCVGCGRCITWCPVGIDITEEARAIRDSERERSHPDAHY